MRSTADRFDAVLSDVSLGAAPASAACIGRSLQTFAYPATPLGRGQATTASATGVPTNERASIRRREGPPDRRREGPPDDAGGGRGRSLVRVGAVRLRSEPLQSPAASRRQRPLQTVAGPDTGGARPRDVRQPLRQLHSHRALPRVAGLLHLGPQLRRLQCPQELRARPHSGFGGRAQTVYQREGPLPQPLGQGLDRWPLAGGSHAALLHQVPFSRTNRS